jgi:hypothetical protein
MSEMAIYRQLTPASSQNLLLFALKTVLACPPFRGKQFPNKQVTSDRHRHSTLLSPIE